MKYVFFVDVEAWKNMLDLNKNGEALLIFFFSISLFTAAKGTEFFEGMLFFNYQLFVCLLINGFSSVT
jgi:hypothetical protein